MKLGYGKDSSIAHEWRSQTLQLLYPENVEELDHRAAELKGIIVAVRCIAAHNVAEKFWSIAYDFFVDPESIQMQEQLSSIFAQAAGISYTIWSRRSRLAIFKVPEVFNPWGEDNTWVDAHPTHNTVLSDDDHCLDGREVVLVTHPAIAIIDGFSGGNFESTKILKDAVCWMGHVAH
jgi:hypothetical protein